MLFIPGETNIHTFVVPMASSNVSSAIVSYKQNGRVVLEKNGYTTSSLATNKCHVTVELTQQDSLKFRDGKDITVQVNVIDINNQRCVSKPIVLTCLDQYHRSVIS